MRTPEEIKVARKMARDKYRASPKYKEWLKNYLLKPSVKETRSLATRKWQTNPVNREKVLNLKARFNLKDKYGITLDQYNIMLSSQNGVCAICGMQDRNGKRLSVDHNHVNGNVRALLCSDCNCAIGLMKENTELIGKMLDYLNKYDNKSM
jgi:hypothetical protein